MPELSWLSWSLLALIAFVAGFTSAVAGGGGMLILPALLAAGVPPLTAMGTTKLQGLFGLLSSTYSFFRVKLIDTRRIQTAIYLAVIGSAFGVWLIQQVDTSSLKTLLPVGLLLVCLYLFINLLRKKPPAPAKLNDRQFNLLVGSASGLYGGAFGPGIGSMLIAAFTSLRGDQLLSAISNSKPIIIAANLVGCIGFIWTGHVWWQLALSMAVSQVIGAQLGARMAIQRGQRFIELMMLVVTGLLALSTLL